MQGAHADDSAVVVVVAAAAAADGDGGGGGGGGAGAPSLPVPVVVLATVTGEVVVVVVVVPPVVVVVVVVGAVCGEAFCGGVPCQPTVPPGWPHAAPTHALVAATGGPDCPRGHPLQRTFFHSAPALTDCLHPQHVHKDIHMCVYMYTHASSYRYVVA